MITRLELKPGQKGTKALLEKYGDALVCVRYRYDEASRTRIKTVELIVDKKELTPSRKKQQKIEDETVVPVRVTYTVKNNWGKWPGVRGVSGTRTLSYGTSRTGRSRGRSWRRI